MILKMIRSKHTEIYFHFLENNNSDNDMMTEDRSATALKKKLPLPYLQLLFLNYVSLSWYRSSLASDINLL